MSTILLLHLLNVVDHILLRKATPPLSVAAQTEVTLPVVVAGLVVLLIVMLVLFWRISRKPQTPAQAPVAQEAGAEPLPIIVPPPLPPGDISLEFITGSEQHVIFKLDKPMLTIGRASDNDVVVTLPILNPSTVSQHHARLRRDQDGYVVRDIGSRNGLKVNGRYTLENLLQDGDRLQFGEAEAIFHQPTGGAA